MRSSALRTADQLRPAIAAAAVLAACGLAGCGSASVAELPPAASAPQSPATTTPPAGAVTPLTHDAAHAAAFPVRFAALRGGKLHVTLDPVARQLRLSDAANGKTRDVIAVGVGPTQVACASRGPCFVTDTTGDALLIVRIPPDGRSMRLIRRVYVAGGPYAITVDRRRRRTWVTLPARNELVELGAHARAHILSRHATVRQPDGVHVDERAGDVTVIGLRPPQRQELADPATPDRP